MIYISSSFPKSASTLLFLYTEEMLSISGKRNGQKVFRKYYKQGYVSSIGILNGLFFLFVNFYHGSLVIKTHGGYNYLTRLLINLGLAKGFYIYRDPRDVLLSAIDHGKKARNGQHKNPADEAFIYYESMEQLYPMIKEFYVKFQQWTGSKKNMIITYYELFSHPDSVLKRLSLYLKLSLSNAEIESLVNQFEAKKSGLKNFNKNKLHRFEEEMSSEQIIEIEKNIGTYIHGMGFKLITPQHNN